MGTRLMLVVMTIAAFLAGCATTPPHHRVPFAGGVPAALAPMHHVSVKQPGCDGDTCPRFSANWPFIAGDPELSAAIEQQVIQFATTPEINGGCGAAQPTLQAMADSFYATPDNAQQSCSIMVSFKRRLSRVVVMEIFVAARGHAVSHAVNYDPIGHHDVTLDEILLPGMREHFYAIYEQQRNTFLKHNTCPWPAADGGPCQYPATTEFEFEPGGVGIVYQLPQGDKPMSTSTWLLGASYQQLDGIIKPEWILH